MEGDVCREESPVMSFKAAGALVGDLGLWGPQDVVRLWELWWGIGYVDHGL